MNDFFIDFVSDGDYKRLLAEILYKGQRLCQISKESGSDNMEAEFLTDLYILPDSISMRFALTDFENIVRVAKRDLAACK